MNSAKVFLPMAYASGAVISSPYLLNKNFAAMYTKRCEGYEAIYIGTLLLLTWPMSLPLTLVGQLPNYLENRSVRRYKEWHERARENMYQKIVQREKAKRD